MSGSTQDILCTRSYKHQTLPLTKGKQDTICNIYKEYRRLSNIILNKQLTHFFNTGKLNVEAKNFYGDIDTFLSENYKDVIKRQVDGMLKSYISNRKNDFKLTVSNSSLSNKQKKELYKINRQGLWFVKENFLARKIFKHLLDINNFPNTKYINMCLNTKIYKLEENKETKSCSYHLLLKLGKKYGEKIIIPLKSNTRFDKILKQKTNYKLNNSVTLCFDRKRNILNDVVLSISYPKAEPIKNDMILGLDWGLKNMFTSNLGDIYSKNFINKLKFYDDKIEKLSKELKKRDKNFKLSNNKRYKKLTFKLRNYIKNEVCRVINRIIKVYNPSKIVLEDLEFREQNLSKRLNRLLSNCGMSVVKLKMVTIGEDLGIDVEYINPCYTSQECSNCHHTHEKNRVSREEFNCQECGYSIQADINASRNIKGRSLDDWFVVNKFANKEKIKQYLVEKHKMFSGCVLSSTKVGSPSKG